MIKKLIKDNERFKFKFSDYPTISSWIYAKSIYEAAENSDAIVILTEWNEFKNIEWSKINNIMRSPSWLIDTRNIACHKEAMNHGISVWRVGIDN